MSVYPEYHKLMEKFLNGGVNYLSEYISKLEEIRDGLTKSQYRAMKRFLNEEVLSNSDAQAMFRAKMRYLRLQRLGDLRTRNEERQYLALSWALPTYKKKN